MKNRPIHSLLVNSPCSEHWEQMSGNDKVRFCSHCSKNVNNLSSMTQKEAQRMARRSGGSLCVRYIEHPLTRQPLYAESLTQITRLRRAPVVAAGVVSATLSLSALTYAQGGAGGGASEMRRELGTDSRELTAPLTVNTFDTGSMQIQIVDPNGAVVPNIEAALLGADGMAVARSRSDYDGTIRFEQINPGTYRVRTEKTDYGFAAKTVSDIRVANGERTDLVIELPIEPVTVTVGIVVLAPGDKDTFSQGDVQALRDHLAAGGDANKTDDDGETPIFEAVGDNELETVRVLIEFGANVNVRNNDGETPLMMIEEGTSLEVVELLLQNGAKVNRTAKDGSTALIRAAENGSPEVLDALIRAGAEIDARDEEGETALMKAADDESIEKVRLLILAGANVNIRDKDGDNAWDFTADPEIEGLLVAHGVELDPGETMTTAEEPEDD